MPEKYSQAEAPELALPDGGEPIDPPAQPRLPTVTEQSRAQADRLLKVLGVKSTTARTKALALELALIIETAVSCAVVRVDNERAARKRAKKSADRSRSGKAGE